MTKISPMPTLNMHQPPTSARTDGFQALVVSMGLGPP